MAGPSKKLARPPMPYTRDALLFIAELGRYRFAEPAFDESMHAKGWTRQETRSALAALERRAWVVKDGSAYVVTDAGHAAATTGQGVQPRPKNKRPTSNHRVKSTRMPKGLF